MSNPLKKTMVYLGLADEEADYEPEPEPRAAQRQPEQQQPQHEATVAKAPVTPLRRAVQTRQPAPAELNEIVTVHPRAYRDAQTIAESFRDGVPVIINLSSMSDGDARRLVDFASGLAMGLFGKIERVTNKVFLLSPQHIHISGQAPAAAPDVDAAF